MFRITEDPSSGSLVQYLAKDYKNDSIVSVDMDKDMQHNTDLVHYQRTRQNHSYNFSQALYKVP